jgi:hypothetical protein
MVRLIGLTLLACLCLPGLSLANDGKDNCGQQANAQGLKGTARKDCMQACTHAGKHGHSGHERDRDHVSKAHRVPSQPATDAQAPAPQPPVAQPSASPAPQPPVAHRKPAQQPAQQQVNVPIPDSTARQQRN